MTIYECLGIDHILLDEQIPIDLIIDNIDDEDLKYDAEIYFRSINSVCLRASIARGEHYLQVIEIELDKPEYIREISFIIQKAIKYRVLFVFIFEGRYLLLRRSFNLAMTTENVYTYNASFCSDWIYEEYLTMDILYSLKFRTVKEYAEADEHAVKLLNTNNDNGDYILFRDLLSCAEGLNRCIIESDCISGRWFLDWLQFHVAGQRVEIEDVIHALRDKEAYFFIEDELFFDKELLKATLSNLDNSKYDLSMDHTGKSPIRYFEDIQQYATKEDVQELMQLIEYDQLYNQDSKESDYFEGDSIPSELKSYCRETYHGRGFTYIPPLPSPSRSPFVDKIIELYQYRNVHLVKYLDLSGRTLLGLKRAKITTLEQVALHKFDDLDFLPFRNRVELIQLMSQLGFRLRDCGKDEYPTISDFINEKLKCQDCGGRIEAYDWTIDNRMCCACTERHERLGSEKLFNQNVSNVTIHTGEESSRIEMRFALSTDEITLDVQLEDAKIIAHDDKEYLFDLTSGLTKPAPLTIKSWRDNEYNLTSGIPGKIYLKDIDLIRIEYHVPNSESAYTFIIKIAHEIDEGRVRYSIVPYDYLDHDVEANKATERFFELLRIELEKRNNENLLQEEEHRKAEEQRQLEEKRRKAEEQRRLEEERRKAEEQRRLEEERRKAEEQRRLEEERRKAEEQRRREEERRKAKEQRRFENERRKAYVQSLVDVLGQAKVGNIARLAYTLEAIHDVVVCEERRREMEEFLLCEAKRKQEEARWIEEFKKEEALRRERERKRVEVIRMEEARRKEVERQQAEILRLEEERKDSVYQNALPLLLSNNIDSVNRAIAMLQSIPDWKDSNKLVREAKEKKNRLVKDRAERQRALYRSQKVCQHCGGKFKGFFKKVCSHCGRSKDY